MMQENPKMEQLVSLTESMLWNTLHKSIHTVLRWRLGVEMYPSRYYVSGVRYTTNDNVN